MNERRSHVLIVEDDESLRPILARHLALKGYRIEEAASAEAASAAIEGGLRPALILLDLNLPGETGWDFLRGPALALAGSPPVVVTTATTVNPRQLTALAVAGYLPKPFAMETLVATVQRFVGARP
ncbi:MAG TPA: response regulator [Candidatus Limnocylindrales bacterium]|nr:response regulator [Candidatus Limnocylindrales bacterium]